MSARSLLLMTALLALPGTARADIRLDDLRDDAHAAMATGMSLLRRALHLPQGDAVVSHAIAVSRAPAENLRVTVQELQVLPQRDVFRLHSLLERLDCLERTVQRLFKGPAGQGIGEDLRD